MLVKGVGYRRLWGKVNALEPLQPYANPRSVPYPGNVAGVFSIEIHHFSNSCHCDTHKGWNMLLLVFIGYSMHKVTLRTM